MRDSTYIGIVIIVFILLVLHAIHQEDKRKDDRRKGTMPCPIERRKGNRRRPAFGDYLLWRLGAKKRVR